LFDKKGTGSVSRETLGDLLRALGQNPTQAEVADIVASAPRDGLYITLLSPFHSTSCFPVDYKTFLKILNRPDGFKPAGTPGATPLLVIVASLTLPQRNSFVGSRSLTRKGTDLLVLES
jgi:hypothetical protein